MADAADSKSVALKSVRVQVPPSAHVEPQGFAALFFFYGKKLLSGFGDHFGDYRPQEADFFAFAKASEIAFVARLFASLNA